jgi:hypothetical protein
MDGGLWLHRHIWFGRAMAHLVSTDRDRLVAWGRLAGLPEERLQHKPLKDPRTAQRRDAWHWDLVGRFLPPPRSEVILEVSVSSAEVVIEINRPEPDAVPPPLPSPRAALQSR